VVTIKIKKIFITFLCAFSVACSQEEDSFDVIKKFEGIRTQAYYDDAGVLTIGYGHTEGVKLGDKITVKQADIIFEKDLKYYKKIVDEMVIVETNKSINVALVSFTYNLGAGSLKRSTLLKKLNSGDYIGASKEFNKWVYVGKRKSKGLFKRRCDERRIFERGIKKISRKYGVR